MFTNINKIFNFKAVALGVLSIIFVSGMTAPSLADTAKSPTVAEVKSFLALQTDQIQAKANSCKNAQQFVSYLKVKAPQIIAFKYMSLWILGKNKSKFSNTQLNEFCNIFSQELIEFYGAVLYQYRNTDLHLVGVDQLGANDYRASFRVPLNKESVNFSWNLKFSPKNGKLLITDMLVNGISFLQTKRFEYSTLLVKHNYDIDSFLADIKKAKPSTVKMPKH